MTPTEIAMANLRKDEEKQKKLQAEYRAREEVRLAEAAEWKKNRPNLRTDIQVGMIAEDCALHIGEVVECDPVEDICRIKSMFDGQIRFCSLYHCGVVVQTPEDIELKQRLFAEGGMEALAKHYFSQMDEKYRPEGY